jgi:hypothetical protein
MIVSARVTDFIHHSGQLGLHFLNILFSFLAEKYLEGNARSGPPKTDLQLDASRLL